MNWRRGFLRLWLVFSLLAAVPVASFVPVLQPATDLEAGFAVLLFSTSVSLVLLSTIFAIGTATRWVLRSFI